MMPYSAQATFEGYVSHKVQCLAPWLWTCNNRGYWWVMRATRYKISMYISNACLLYISAVSMTVSYQSSWPCAIAELPSCWMRSASNWANMAVEHKFKIHLSLKCTLIYNSKGGSWFRRKTGSENSAFDLTIWKVFGFNACDMWGWDSPQALSHCPLPLQAVAERVTRTHQSFQ